MRQRHAEMLPRRRCALRRHRPPMTPGELESKRTLEIDRLRILDTQPDDDFDSLAELAAAICETPFALVSVVYRTRQWFKARFGTALEELQRDISFCTHAIEQPDELLVVEDACADPRFAQNPLVTEAPFVRFYAGMPIVSRGGVALGSVCVLDVVPRSLSSAQRTALRTLAKQASALFELHRSIHDLESGRESAANYRLVDQFASGLVFFVRTADSRILDVSAGCAAAYGYPRERLCELTWTDLAAQGECVAADAPGDAEGYGAFHECEHLRGDGTIFSVEVAAIPTTLGGEPVAMFVVRDISERKARELAAGRYQLLAEGARDMILFARCGDRQILEANGAACATYGYTLAELRALHLTDLREGSAADFDAVIEAVERGEGVHESMHRRKDGSTFPAEVTAVVSNVGAEDVIFAIVRDISERVRVAALTLARGQALEASNAALRDEINDRKAAETRLAYAGFHDDLTGLPNRALFMDRLKHMVARVQRRSDHMSAILVLDIDRFKSINDSLGHVVGDLVLIAIARRLERCFRVGDTFARLGGDEFSVLLDGIKDAAQATRFAERILRELKPPFFIPHHGDVFVSASIGVVVSNTGFDLPDDLLRSADVAMYQAKAEGKQRAQLFRSELLTRAAGVLALETDLNLALERHEFRLAYQPIVALADGRITGFEALLRWQHPERGNVAPNDFIPVAEETGIIVQIGEWVLAEACRQATAWHKAYTSQQHLTVNVNVSAKQVASASFLLYVRETLAKHSICVSNLQLEITETALMTDNAASAELLQELRMLGMPVHLDDFGTGYSSLAYLHRFPVDTLKIDRSFVSGAGSGLANPEIVQAIIALAKGLSIETIAEGIETREQFEGLRALGCQRGQGYFFARPLDVAAATAAIAAGGMLMPLQAT